MNSTIVTADEAAALIKDGDTLCCNGFVHSGYPDALLDALERRFLETGSPRNLTLFAAAGQSDGKDRGTNKLALHFHWEEGGCIRQLRLVPNQREHL